MTAAAYDRALAEARPLVVYPLDGRPIALDVRRWLADVDADDETVLDRCTGPVLDVGCGPGRFVRALNRRGVPALGVDIAERAVAITRGHGAAALLRDVFARVPGEGRWPTVLLLDGNIGIGGRPARLLHRLRALTAPAARIIVELDPDPRTDRTLLLRLSRTGPTFPWSLVGEPALRRHAATTGLHVQETWTAGRRLFAIVGGPARA